MALRREILDSENEDEDIEFTPVKDVHPNATGSKDNEEPRDATAQTLGSDSGNVASNDSTDSTDPSFFQRVYEQQQAAAASANASLDTITYPREETMMATATESSSSITDPITSHAGPGPTLEPAPTSHPRLKSLLQRLKSRNKQQEDAMVVDLTATQPTQPGLDHVPPNNMQGAGGGVWDMPGGPQPLPAQLDGPASRPSRGRTTTNTTSHTKRKRGQQSSPPRPSAVEDMPDTQDPYAFPDDPSSPPSKKKTKHTVQQQTDSLSMLYVAPSTLTASQKQEYRVVSPSSQELPPGAQPYPDMSSSLSQAHGYVSSLPPSLPPAPSFAPQMMDVGGGSNCKSSGLSTIAYSTPSRFGSSARERGRMAGIEEEHEHPGSSPDVITAPTQSARRERTRKTVPAVTGVDLQSSVDLVGTEPIGTRSARKRRSSEITREDAMVGPVHKTNKTNSTTEPPVLDTADTGPLDLMSGALMDVDQSVDPTKPQPEPVPEHEHEFELVSDKKQPEPKTGKGKRGRKKKEGHATDEDEAPVAEDKGEGGGMEEPPVKKGRGRPRKGSATKQRVSRSELDGLIRAAVYIAESQPTTPAPSDGDGTPKPGRRGRPRKEMKEVYDGSDLDGPPADIEGADEENVAHNRDESGERKKPGKKGRPKKNNTEKEREVKEVLVINDSSSELDEPPPSPPPPPLTEEADEGAADLPPLGVGKRGRPTKGKKQKIVIDDSSELDEPPPSEPEEIAEPPIELAEDPPNPEPTTTDVDDAGDGGNEPKKPAKRGRKPKPKPAPVVEDTDDLEEPPPAAEVAEETVALVDTEPVKPPAKTPAKRGRKPKTKQTPAVKDASTLDEPTLKNEGEEVKGALAETSPNSQPSIVHGSSVVKDDAEDSKEDFKEEKKSVKKEPSTSKPGGATPGSLAAAIGKVQYSQYRVGLSKRSRIAPLLKSLKK
ncbi:hypothetical protein QBC46DRAFT_415097 [Diplogelasinospora grovesii]|uniref:Uncharacterized protein n=1 Tax=Diplogelasinospora grovesii TaxID=303347 RepID=A0AAN6NI63_9PEZI|nr:hypothetical protein QBC46DRAFT_415097 [Diplogelasinospora grovesii]